MENSERLRLQGIISELVRQLGGEARLKESDISSAKNIEVGIDHDGITIRVEVKND